MRLILNIIWLIFGGLVQTVAWLLAGLIMCILIVTIPLGLQAFKIAGFTIWPFGRTLVSRPRANPALAALGNVAWVILAGWWLALLHLVAAILQAITIIGLPLAAANIKLIGVCFVPFGREVVPRALAEAREQGITL